MTDKQNHDHTHDDQEFITLVDEEGNEELYQILLTFESDEFEQSYVIVYPANASEDDELELFAFRYEDPDQGLEGKLSDVETDEEWDMIEEVIGAFMEDEEDL